MEPDSTKIEHWRCQSRYQADQLNYRNLLGACQGGEGSPSRFQRCDTFKGDRDLLYNPAEPAHHIETRIRYSVEGTIHSDETVFDGQLNSVLHLNLPLLVSNRKAVLDAVTDWWKHERARARGPVPKALLIRKRNRLIDNTGDLQPYCQVAVWFLNRKLANMPP
jgi:uncharacterized protein (TIGR02646 family)